MNPQENVPFFFVNRIAGYNLAADWVTRPNLAVHALKVVQQGEAHVIVYHDQVGSPF